MIKGGPGTKGGRGGFIIRRSTLLLTDYIHIAHLCVCRIHDHKCSSLIPDTGRGHIRKSKKSAWIT